MWSAAIIAGGGARRLGGRDKSRLTIGPSTILDHQVSLLSRVADEVLIVTSESAAGRFDQLRLPVLVDRLSDRGPIGGIYTAVSAATHDRVVVVACDMPFLTEAFLRHLTATGMTADVAVPRTHDGYEPLCATYSRRCEEPLRERLEAGLLKAADFLRDAAEISVREIGPEELEPFDSDGTLFFNVNTLDDLQRAIVLWDRRHAHAIASQTGRTT